MAAFAWCVTVAMLAADSAAYVPVTRSGAAGLGLGVDLPVLGVTAGAAPASRIGLGYTWGAALSFDVTPAWALRLHANTLQTYNGWANLTYATTTGRAQSSQETAWLMHWFGLGAMHVWREAEPTWAPFAGLDVGFGIGGFRYTYTPMLQAMLQASADTAPEVRVEHDSYGQLWTARLRGGVRLQLRPWLASDFECSATFVPFPATPITNNRDVRDARAGASNIVFMSLTYGLHLTL